MVSSVILVIVGFGIGWVVGNRWDEITSKALKKNIDKVNKNG